MDMIAVDLRNNYSIKLGDEVILWGEGLPLEEVSSYSPNINWNILTGI